MGSWPFIVIQSIILVAWVTLNLVCSHSTGSLPVHFVNLALSFQAAYAAPIIMMSQNRQQDIDRPGGSQRRLYQINIKAELEIEALHEKLEHCERLRCVRYRTVQQLSALLERAIVGRPTPGEGTATAGRSVTRNWPSCAGLR